MFHTYIIFNSNINQYYIGSTNNIEDRLYRHNAGQNKATKKGAPDWQLVYSEEFNTRSEAVQREMKIKKMKSRKYIERLINCD
jgi:putative endonuclease